MKAAAKSHATTSGIINREVSQTLHTATQGALPKESSVRRTIQRERRRNLPPLPKSASEIDIEGKWRETSNGEDWLIFDESVEGGMGFDILDGSESVSFVLLKNMVR